MGISRAAFLFLFLLSSVKGDILDDYLRTDGVWLLTRNKQVYNTNNEKECAEKCEAERNFNCRAFLFTRKKLQCLTLAENTKMTVTFDSVDVVLYEKKIIHLKNTPMQGWKKTTAEILMGMNVDPGVTQQILLPDLITVTSQSVRARSRTLEKNLQWNACSVMVKTTMENFPEQSLGFSASTGMPKSLICMDLPQNTMHLPVSGLGSQCLSGKGENYRGRIAVTESGKACQPWNTQFPHKHGWIPDRYPCKGLEENYCRNPDGEKRPWCYTINGNVRWEYCAIPHCDGPEQGIADVPVQVPLPEECYQGRGQSYRGTASITASGKKCQAWNSMFPHRHEKTPDRFPDADLRDNYCRNPDGDESPWCFTTDPNVTWEYCNLKRCDDHTQKPAPNDPPATTAQNSDLSTPTTSDCINGNGKDYRGTVAKTARGRTCQEWSSQKPHSHKYFTPVTHPGAGLDKNFCRNPDGDVNGVWCFTTDPEKKWEYCEIPRCSSSEHDCGKVSTRSERACAQYIMCNASPGSWPWHISLRMSNNMHHCAGTLIHPQWVLTAAQCLQRPTEPSAYRVFLGIQNLIASEPSLQIRSVQKVLKEPSGADIALLKLNSPVTINDHVKPVCLPETSLMVGRNAVCFLTAWGKKRGTDTDNRLKDVEFPVLENRICNRPEFLNGSVKNNEFCGGFTFGSIGNCEAEAGGPLVCKDKDRFVQYGVTSWGLDCTQPSKPVFVRIPSFVSWIKNAMAAH
ncbi:plasminogen-like isoform X2 [Falco naumanni]|uniref:plasminogen-like isoform X2 n=1 Tax=Falco naumanni TaxID=148594 RepID=UPI001ADE09B1|nr:plasminogen-like isoform X2 [Falco naumanni]